MWLFFAFLSALFASLVTIFGKLGLKDVDSTVATGLRAVIMAVFLILVLVGEGKLTQISPSLFSRRDWLLITLSGVAGATSWIFYFLALKSGPASAVAAIDRLSLVFIVFLAAIFLGETFGWKTLVGTVLMVGGALLLTFK
jgi:transporter family protein